MQDDGGSVPPQAAATPADLPTPSGQSRAEKSATLRADPPMRACLLAKEKELTGQIATAGNAEDRKEAILTLAQFYLFQCSNRQKATALLLLVPPDQGFAVRVQIIEAEKSTPQQKLSEYESLRKLFPQLNSRLQFLINSTKQEH